MKDPATWRTRVSGVIFVNLATMCWASNAVLGRWLRADIGPLTLTTLRFAAAVVWAFYSVFGRRVMRNRSAVSATALSNFIGLPLIAAAAALELRYIPVNLRMETVAAIVHICIVPTIIGYWSWNKAVRALGAGGAMVFYNTLPLYGVLLGAALLGESLGMNHFVFGGLILGGGLWATLGKGRPRS